MREMGYDPNDKERIKEMQKSAGPAYFVAFIASLVSAFILALFLHHMNAHNLEYGLLIGSHVWLGFVATVQLTGALFMKQSMKLFAIQHWLPTRLLPRHVCHPDPLALAQILHESHSIRRTGLRRDLHCPGNIFTTVICVLGPENAVALALTAPTLDFHHRPE